MAKLVEILKREFSEGSDSLEINERQLQAKADAAIGSRALKEGDYEKAVRYMTSALDLDSQLGNFTFFNNRSVAYYRLGSYVDCLDDVKKALKLEIGALQCYKTAYKALQKMECHDESFAYYCKWFTLNSASRNKILEDGTLLKLADASIQSSLLIDFNSTATTSKNSDLLSKLLKIAENLVESRKLVVSTYVYEAAIIVSDFLQRPQATLPPILLTLAKILQDVGDSHASLAHLTQLEALASLQNDIPLQIESLKHQGKCLHELKDFHNALACHEKERVLVEKRGDPTERASLLERLGNVSHVLGDFKKAIKYFEELLQLGRQLQNRVALAAAHFRLGKIQCVLANVRQAVWHFGTQLNVVKKEGDKRGQIQALSELGRAHLTLRQYAEAAKCFEEALQLAGDCAPARARCLHDLGLVRYHLKRYDVAIGYFEEARVGAQQENDKLLEASVCCHVAVTHYHGLGNFLLGVSNLKSALELCGNGDPVLSLQCHEKLGAIYFNGNKGHHQKAEFHLRTAIDTFETMRREFGSFDRLKQRVVEMPQGAYSKLIHLLALRGDTKEALRVAECFLAREYVEKVLPKQDIQLLNPFRQLPAGLMSYDDIVRLVTQLDAQVLFYVHTEFGLYIWVLHPHWRGLAKFHHWPKDAVQYLAPFLKQTHHIVSTLPAGIPSRVCEQRFCPKLFVEDLAATATAESGGGGGGGAAALGEEAPPPPYSSMVSVAHRYGLAYSTIGNDDLLHPNRSSYLAAPAGEGYSAVLQASMKELYDVLIGPVERHLSQLLDGDWACADLVIVPHGNMYLLPFSSLVSSGRKLLSSAYRTRLMPCLQTLAMDQSPRARISRGRRISGTGENAEITSALILGNPSLPETVKYHGRHWTPSNLPFAEREARHVSLLLGPGFEPSTGTSPTRERVLSKVLQATVIHLATFGSWELGSFVVAPSPASGPEITEKDYLITPNDLSQMSLAAKLVVLSGFNSVANQDLVTADSLLCTARSFLLAGARAVILSLWSPPDRATDEMVFALYEGLHRGLSISEAIRQGMVHIRSRRGFIDPIHWSGFVVIGNDGTVDMQEADTRRIESQSRIDQSPSKFLDYLQLILICDFSSGQVVKFLRLLANLINSAISKLNQGRSGHSTLLTDLDDDFFIFPSWREILLVLGFSFRLNAREEDVLVFPLESSQLDLLNIVLNFLNSLIALTQEREECLRRLACILPLEHQTNMGIQFALRRAKATIPEDDSALYGVWAMDEPRAFLESLGIYQIADHEENVLLSPSDVYSEELASKAIVCLENLTKIGVEAKEGPFEGSGEDAEAVYSSSPRLISVLENLKHDFTRKLQSGLSGNVASKDKPNSCSLCEAKFSLFRRRYHCRFCDRVLCSKCYDQTPADWEETEPSVLRRVAGICMSCQLMFPEGSLIQQK
ncbi:tetratricopeptide repeat protein 28-like isoform X2 [Oscarella lobularis]|uniref:tetratricopeptide repeat protein 28-like isoform X2 n=1 Tax=Oscarella lobularis TaxID=121494 RepID=UPI003313F7BE